MRPSTAKSSLALASLRLLEGLKLSLRTSQLIYWRTLAFAFLSSGAELGVVPRFVKGIDL